MARHHVAQRPRRIVKLASLLDANRLRHGDLDMIDVIAVPHRLEETVGKAEHHDVLHGLLSEIVVDAVGLALSEHAEDLAVERLGRAEIVAERLLNNHPSARSLRLADEAGTTKFAHDSGECRCWSRKVE